MNLTNIVQRIRYAGVGAVIMVALVSGCGTGISFGTGGGGGQSSPAPTPSTSQEKSEPEPTPQEPEASPTVKTKPKATPTPSQQETQEPSPAENAESKGDIELSVEGRPGVEEFYFKAIECSVTDTEVNVRGVGIDLSTGEPSEVTIVTKPHELLHEKSGTFQASGQVKVTVANEAYISDGRLETVQGHVLPSMFTYRVAPPKIKYVVAWFAGPTNVSAGYIHVNCFD